MGLNRRREIVMTDEEVAKFLGQRRTATMATTSPDGTPHLVAMWYGLLGGRVCFETKHRSQKAANLRRDPTVGVLVEVGRSYDQLRGVSIVGRAHIVDDPLDQRYWDAAISVFERYNQPYSEEHRPAIESAMHKRLVVIVEPKRVRTWDHRKLGLEPMQVAGSTAQFLDDL